MPAYAAKAPFRVPTQQIQPVPAPRDKAAPNAEQKAKSATAPAVAPAPVAAPEEKSDEAFDGKVIEEVKFSFVDKDGNPVKPHIRGYILERESRYIRPNAVFKLANLVDDCKALYRLNLFDDVRADIVQKGASPDKISVLWTVQEGQSASVSGSAGASAAGMYGSLTVAEKNVLGKNQHLQGEIRLGPEDLMVDVSVEDRNLAHPKSSQEHWSINPDAPRLAARVFANHKKYQSPHFMDVNAGASDPSCVIYLKNTGFGGLLKHVNDPWSVIFGASAQRIVLTDSNGNVTALDSRNSPVSFTKDGVDDLIIAEVGAVRDTRDLHHRSGSLISAKLEQSLPVGKGRILFNRIKADATLFSPVSVVPVQSYASNGQTLVLNMQAGTVLGNLPPYEAFRLGGSDSVRGFSEAALASARSYVQGSAEYHLPVHEHVGLTAFVDAASDLGSSKSVYGDPGGVRGRPGKGAAAGVGIQIPTPLGVLRAEIALNHLGQWKLNYALGTRY